MNDNNIELVPPNPSSLIQSMRSIGYDLPTSIADIIDNSISASAKNVWITFFWNGEDSYISIEDDGTGMTEETLVNAMRLGSVSIDQQREQKDLGRFGLGLKTASFSQCKKLTVITKAKNSEISVRCWDLDFIIKSNNWCLLKTYSTYAQELARKINSLKTGTIVVLESLDRITSGTHTDNQKDQERFLNEAEMVKEHLAMVFHKFLERPNGLKIWINKREIKPWDPYLTKEPATQNLTEEIHNILGDKLTVKPYVLPHITKISESSYKYGAGPKGWNAQQGFYVYRNSRLLVAGDWLGLGFQKEEYYKLARIMIDIPSSLDDKWGIDVKKSKATPPSQFRSELKRIAQLTRERAVEVFRHRGKIISRENDTNLSFIWERKIVNGKLNYTINRNNPLIKDLLDNPDVKDETTQILKMIEESLPISTIIIDAKEHPVQDKEPFQEVPTKEMTELAQKFFDIFIKNGYNSGEAKQKILSLEPFNLYPEIISLINLNKGDLYE